MENKTTTVKLSLFERVVKALTGGDEGRVRVFFTKLKKSLERAKEKHEKNLDLAEYNHKANLSALQEKLEDAQNALEAAFENVDVNRIKTNADIDDYINDYLDVVGRDERKVQDIEAQIEAAVESIEETRKVTTEKIAILNVRIASIG